jgi:uncharacterized membrane protein
VGGVWIIGRIIFFLAANFDSVPNEIRSFQLAAYSFTPFFLGGVCYILPFLSIFVFFAGFYGMYLLSLGLPVLMETPEEKTVFYIVTVGAVMLFIILIIGHLTGGVLWPSKP